MDLTLFDYELPDGFIAYHPAKRRDGSKLMILNRASGELTHRKFPAVVNFLKKGDGLVINNTKVFKARLFARRPSGGKVELFLLEEIKFEGKDAWQVLTHPTRRVKEGEDLILDDEASVRVIRKMPDGKSVVAFKSKAEGARVINRLGHVPLPIYIHRPDEKGDENRYQTVYANARKAKAVAAPTAGLHFTEKIMAEIAARGVKIIPITLHVGHGTFRTIKAANIEDHSVDPEFAEINKSAATAINKIRNGGGNIFAVGTTSTRALEAAPLTDGEIQPMAGAVDLYIYPGHKFQVVDHLITNFHLPKSSLIILAAAFAGREKILEAYRVAVEQQYRFYSYGDCMLIL